MARAGGSSILRRLLGLNRQASAGKTAVAILSKETPKTSAIDDCLSSARVLANRDVVGRFLGVLAWLHQKHGKETFAKVLQIEGRKRKYFSMSFDDLNASDSSVNPQRIPDSDFWVVTNNDTPKKARILTDVLQVLGYSWIDIKKMTQSLGS